ncbi:hypothetical protein [Hoeflea sp. TYP-13]|uniref:hypothetical protein n=1 Tax=Hoeflea sp. TYP-13 TaxID=3230023 RepID=UPI0034C626B0
MTLLKRWAPIIGGEILIFAASIALKPDFVEANMNWFVVCGIALLVAGAFWSKSKTEEGKLQGTDGIQIDQSITAPNNTGIITQTNKNFVGTPPPRFEWGDLSDASGSNGKTIYKVPLKIISTHPVGEIWVSVDGNGVDDLHLIPVERSQVERQVDYDQNGGLIRIYNASGRYILQFEAHQESDSPKVKYGFG